MHQTLLCIPFYDFEFVFQMSSAKICQHFVNLKEHFPNSDSYEINTYKDLKFKFNNSKTHVFAL